MNEYQIRIVPISPIECTRYVTITANSKEEAEKLVEIDEDEFISSIIEL